jgi:hypothetical protein
VTADDATLTQPYTGLAAFTSVDLDGQTVLGAMVSDAQAEAALTRLVVAARYGVAADDAELLLRGLAKTLDGLDRLTPRRARALASIGEALGVR